MSRIEGIFVAVTQRAVGLVQVLQGVTKVRQYMLPPDDIGLRGQYATPVIRRQAPHEFFKTFVCMLDHRLPRVTHEREVLFRAVPFQ